jgi:hypothetical protein
MTMKGIVMKPRYRLFRRAGVFYYEDTITGQQLPLRMGRTSQDRRLS